MAKKRVYEYAKEKDLSSREVIMKAKEMGIEFSSHMSSMDDDQVERLNKVYDQSTKEGNTSNKTVVKPNNTTNSSSEKTPTNSNKPRSKKKASGDEQEESATSRNRQTRTRNKLGNQEDDTQRARGKRRGNRRGKQKNKKSQTPPTPRKFKELPEVLVYKDGMTVAEISKKLHREPAELVKKLFLMGVPATQNQSLDKTAIELLAEDYGIQAEEKVEIDISDLSIYFDEEANEEKLETR